MSVLFIIIGIFGLLLLFFSILLSARKGEPAAERDAGFEASAESSFQQSSGYDADFDIFPSGLDDAPPSGHAEGGLEDAIRRYEQEHPVFVSDTTMIPVLRCDADALDLDENEYCHFQEGSVFYEAELQDPVFTMDGSLTEDNQRIFFRCLGESGVGRIFISSARILFYSKATTLMISLRNIEGFTAHEGHLVVKELGLSSLSVFFLRHAGQAAAILAALHKRKKLLPSFDHGSDAEDFYA
jgi:hypothetical protein